MSPVHVVGVREVPGPGEEVGGQKVDDAFRAKELGAKDVSLNTFIVVEIKRQQLSLSTKQKLTFHVVLDGAHYTCEPTLTARRQNVAA